MPRIRSVHPGIWTDEAFVSVSPHARLLFIGLLNESDDQGVFTWKPVTLRMRLAPADNVDPEALLQELLTHRMVMRFDHEGQAYGAVKNFRRYQRPQKPKAIHPLPAQAAAFVGRRSPARGESEEDGSPFSEESPTDTLPVAEASRTGPRMSEQMEEGGGRRERKESPPTPLTGGSEVDLLGDQIDPPAVRPDQLLWDVLVEWNQSKHDDAPSVKDIGDDLRRRRTGDLLARAGSIEQVRRYFDHIANQAGLTGQGRSEFVAFYDWCIRPEIITRLSEEANLEFSPQPTKRRRAD